MKDKLKLKAILFDLDDTILDSKTAEYNAICSFKTMFNEFDTINEEKFAELWHSIIVKLYDKYLKGEISFKEQRVKRIEMLFSTVNNIIGDDEAKERFKIYFDLYKKNWILFDDATEVLQELKSKYKMGIVSNGDSEQQREKIKITKLEKYFSEIIISDEIGFAKPNKKIFEIACDKLNVKPNECLMIGDKFNIDIEGAINSGMEAIWVNRKNENIKYKFTVKQLKEILQICKEL